MLHLLIDEQSHLSGNPHLLPPPAYSNRQSPILVRNIALVRPSRYDIWNLPIREYRRPSYKPCRCCMLQEHQRILVLRGPPRHRTSWSTMVLFRRDVGGP
jgi:hypothetical protein